MAVNLGDDERVNVRVVGQTDPDITNQPSELSKDVVLRGKRIVETKYQQGKILKPHISSLFGDAYIYLHEELRSLVNKKADGREISAADSRKYQQLTDALVKLAREEREQIKAERVEELSEEELIEALQKAKDSGLL